MSSFHPGARNQVGTPSLPLARLHGGAFRDTFSNNFFKEGSLLGNIDHMSIDQLKERLLVAESLMKKLYDRNKDIETYHRQKQESGRKRADSPEREDSNQMHDLDIIQEFKNREEKLNTELTEKQQEIDRLKLENQQLIRNAAPARTDRSNEKQPPN